MENLFFDHEYEYEQKVLFPVGAKPVACLEPERVLRGTFVIDYIQKGGLLMWPILVCSIISIAVFAERLFYLHRATIHVGEFLQGSPI